MSDAGLVVAAIAAGIAFWLSGFVAGGLYGIQQMSKGWQADIDRQRRAQRPIEHQGCRRFESEDE